MAKGSLMPSLIIYGQVESTTVSLTRVTEAGDTRITESGDIRVTGDATSNTITSTIVANATVKLFNADSYINDNGVWKKADIYVKHSGTWKVPNGIFKKQSGVWRRVH